jgi:tRNA(fMet)-specific endonuclease VapC
VTTDESGILDTSVLIDLPHLASDGLPREPLISVITLAELAAGPSATDDEEERARRQLRLQFVEASFEPLPFGAAEARAFGLVSSALRRSGRKSTARAFDALIAATAIAAGVPVYTRNPRDFEGIPGLRAVEVARSS